MYCQFSKWDGTKPSIRHSCSLTSEDKNFFSTKFYWMFLIKVDLKLRDWLKYPAQFQKRFLLKFPIRGKQWSLLQSHKQIWFTFDKVTGSRETPRFEYNLNKFRCDISCTSGAFLVLPAIVMNYWRRLVQEGSLKCHHGFVFCTLQLSIQ